MLAVARDLGMGALVETHADDELDRALASGAEVIGVNARDLESLEVDVVRARERLRRIPARPGRGVRVGRQDARTTSRPRCEAGASAILVGEALMRAADPRAAVRELIARGDGPT